MCEPAVQVFTPERPLAIPGSVTTPPHVRSSARVSLCFLCAGFGKVAAFVRGSLRPGAVVAPPVGRSVFGKVSVLLYSKLTVTGGLPSFRAALFLGSSSFKRPPSLPWGRAAVFPFPCSPRQCCYPPTPFGSLGWWGFGSVRGFSNGNGAAREVSEFLILIILFSHKLRTSRECGRQCARGAMPRAPCCILDG